MSRFFAVDPGLRSCGLAMFVDRQLVATCLVEHRNGNGPSQWVGMAAAVDERIRELAGGRLNPTDEVVIEYMQTRRGKRKAHDALIQLSQVSGAIYALTGRNGAHAPANVWTGGRKKQKNHPRIKRRLKTAEKKVLKEALLGTPKGSWKELLDAVGIGLWHGKRL